MTRQEAIETIKTAIARVEWEYPLDYAVAFDMAIEALSQQEIIRCKDCKYYKGGFCYNPNTFDDEKTRGNTVPDWFCADSERRDG
jgi:hypothetical protein